MAMEVKEVRKWMKHLKDDDFIAVEDGGLAIVVLSSATSKNACEVQDFGVFCEIGGVPPEEGRDDPTP